MFTNRQWEGFPTLSGRIFVILDEPSQTKISHFAHQVVSHQDVSSSQVSVHVVHPLHVRHPRGDLRHTPSSLIGFQMNYNDADWLIGAVIVTDIKRLRKEISFTSKISKDPPEPPCPPAVGGGASSPCYPSGNPVSCLLAGAHTAGQCWRPD